MHGLIARRKHILPLFLAMALLCGGAASLTPQAWAGSGGKDGKHGNGGRGGGHSKEYAGDHDGRSHGDKEKISIYFGEQHREAVRGYYREQYRLGACPPGLAKKNNGCLPPGHAKRWMIGQPLPADIVVYELPPVLITQLGPPPQGHRYVRVDADILLLAIGTGMVIDALQNLSDR